MTQHESPNHWFQQYGISISEAANSIIEGEASIIIAARQGQAQILAFLLEQGATTSPVDRYGNNALWAACYAESLECMSLLLNAGIDINFRNPNGSTVLMYASSSGKHGVVEYLLEQGADWNMTNQDDFSAMDLAANRECLKLLRNISKLNA